MYQVIARKYRPTHFGDLVGQEHVRGTLSNAITQNRIAHGYIFSGQRGTGKTTVARILARCLNCQNGPTPEPCLTCSTCIEIGAGNSVDVIEIDAASNRGINEMRELRESVRYRPAKDRFKVFIIDEAHQITNEAFNALLKTLEEPPEWAVFMMCTTESHKIPTTILSRCQQFNFRSVEFAELVERMKWICAQEGIEAEDEALAVIAQAGEGSVRDSLSALDQAIASGGSKLVGAAVRDLLGLFSLQALGTVTDALKDNDSKRMLDLVADLERGGHQFQHYVRELARYFRNLLVAKLSGVPTRLIPAPAPEQEVLAATAKHFGEDDLTRYLQITLDIYRDLQYSMQPRLHLELGLLRLIHAGRLKSIEEAIAGMGSPPAAAAPASRPPAAKPASAPSLAAPFTPTSAPVASAPPAARLAAVPASESLRDRLLAKLTDDGHTFIADAVEHSTLIESGAEMKFTGPREFSLNFKDPILKSAIEALFGRAVRVSFTAGEASGAVVAAAPVAAASSDDAVTREALANPEVQRFQEMFPGSHVRNVRNLKDI
jgi:DNA polymerase III subunit gamma/tau